MAQVIIGVKNFTVGRFKCGKIFSLYNKGKIAYSDNLSYEPLSVFFVFWNFRGDAIAAKSRESRKSRKLSLLTILQPRNKESIP